MSVRVPAPTPAPVTAERARGHARLPWPLPALLAWMAGWLAWGAAGRAGWGTTAAAGTALLVATLLALPNRGWRRRAIAAGGFPLSAIALGLAAQGPAWVWGVPLLPLLAVYPLRAWRDAPLFPTPADALQGLDALVPAPARVLDAGCGLGHGLLALRRLWPQAELHGVEWSPLLAAAASWRLWRARARVQVRRGDMWGTGWGGHDVIYLFQRPESMARAWDKAARELSPGGWLVSLEFAVPGQVALACLGGAGRKPLWLYQPAGPAPAGSTAAAAGR